jgi:hypothetical protein
MANQVVENGVKLVGENILPGAMSKRESIRRYTNLWAALNEIVLRWDLYGLYAAGEFDDEFSGEVSQLLAALPKVETENDVVLAVSKVFSHAFGGHDFSQEACRAVGHEIFQWWQAQE